MYNKKYKQGLWSGKISLVDHNGNFPLGLIKTLVAYIIEQGYKDQLVLDKNIKVTPSFESEQKFNDWISSLQIYSKGVAIKPYWYQSQSVFKALQQTRCILNLPTSSGKSLIQCLLAKWYTDNFADKVLIIVPTTALTVQMKNDFVDYKLFKENEIAEIRANTSHFVYDKKVVVSTWQSAVKKDPEWFEQFGMLLCDEMHLATGQSISSMTKAMVNCRYKIGLTGTLKDGKANIMTYVGLFGDIFKPVTTEQLMEDGQATKLKIKVLKLDYPEEDVKYVKKYSLYDEEIDFIVNHDKRTELLSRIAVNQAMQNENVLLLFRFTKHGKALHEAVKKRMGANKVFYIDGDIKTEDRVKIQNFLENNTGAVVICSYATTGTGISIKNLHTLIFGHPTKSKVTVLQTIGRSLRLHESKEYATVIDVVDNLSAPTKRSNNFNFAMKHGLERIQRYNEEKFDYQLISLKV